MSINQSHYQGGLLLYQGEQIVHHSKNVTLSFDSASRQCGEIFRGKHKGKVFVTTHRMIFLTDDARDSMLSFAVAFMYIKDLRVEQPIFGANYLTGVAAAHPNGGFQGEVKFELTYSSGGAIDASRALREVNSIFHRQNQPPPSYGIAAANLYEPPPPSYQAAQATNNNFAETNMYVSPAQAPYQGVYQLQPTGLPKAEFIPQYPEMPSAPSSAQSTMYPNVNNGFGGNNQVPMQYPPQPAYQNNSYGEQMYVPQQQQQQQQNYPMPPSYEQSQHDVQQKKRD